MPKVKDGYFEDKKNAILDVAEKICMEKPLNKVTMKDIIDATGLSPGAVYASFSDIDEVFVALLNRISFAADYMSDVERILQENTSPEGKIDALIRYMIKQITMSSGYYGKLVSELSYVFVAIKGKERREKYRQSIKTTHISDYVNAAYVQIVEENVANGYFEPLVSKESIYAMGAAITDGLIRNLTFVKHYKYANLPMGITFEEDDLPKAVADSIIFLLNPKGGLSEHG